MPLSHVMQFAPMSRRVWARPVILLTLAVAGCGAKTSAVKPSGKGADATVAEKAPIADVSTRSDDFVGSAACAKCHGDESLRYHRHSMSQSLTEALQAVPVEDYAHPGFSTEDGVSY